jgi:hypothetical protein
MREDCRPSFRTERRIKGNGGVAIAADPQRDAFFAADVRFGSTNNVSAVGLFRASSATLLNTTLCHNGTHTAAQAKSCWEATPAVVLDPNPPGSLTATLDFPSVVVDERASGTGVGAGDRIWEIQCEQRGNRFGCVHECDAFVQFTYHRQQWFAGVRPGRCHVQVRTDGKITVTWVDQNAAPSKTIHFVLCTPAPPMRPHTTADRRATFGTSHLPEQTIISRKSRIERVLQKKSGGDRTRKRLQLLIHYQRVTEL